MAGPGPQSGTPFAVRQSANFQYDSRDGNVCLRLRGEGTVDPLSPAPAALAV